MNAEILAIGSEILLGETIDTNSATIATKLQAIGVPLHYTSTVGDHMERIVASIQLALERSDILITTGGLGPTVDDVTRQAMALAIGKPLIFDLGLLSQIEERFERWGRKMTDNNRRQALRPEGSLALENPVGTAPCFIIEHNGRIAACLPGVPREMEYMMDNAILPYLRRRFDLHGVIKSRALNVSGAGESLIDEQIGDLESLENPAVGLNADSGVMVIRLTAHADSEEQADELIAPVESTIRERLGKLVFGADGETLENWVLAELKRRGEILAVVESGTGGRLTAKLSQSELAHVAFAEGRFTREFAYSTTIIEWAQKAADQANAHWGMACAIKADEGSLLCIGGIWHSGRREQWHRRFGGHSALAAEWSANTALNALRNCLLSSSD
jgi:competence/damage-inducible protein CinA-like protein